MDSFRPALTEGQGQPGHLLAEGREPRRLREPPRSRDPCPGDRREPPVGTGAVQQHIRGSGGEIGLGAALIDQFTTAISGETVAGPFWRSGGSSRRGSPPSHRFYDIVQISGDNITELLLRIRRSGMC